MVLPERLLTKMRELRKRNDHGRCSSVGTVTRLRAGQLRNRGSIPRWTVLSLSVCLSLSLTLSLSRASRLAERVRWPLYRFLRR
jgi:hypothetical protein